MVVGGGFEPPKASPTDLQSVPFGRSGTPPKIDYYYALKTVYVLITLFLKNPLNTWSQRRDSNPRPTDYKSVALPAELRWHMTNFKDQKKTDSTKYRQPKELVLLTTLINKINSD